MLSEWHEPCGMPYISTVFPPKAVKTCPNTALPVHCHYTVIRHDITLIMHAIVSLLRQMTSRCPGACSSRCNIGLWVMLCEYFVWIFYIIFQTNPSTTILSHSEWYFDSAGCHPKREYCSVTVASVNTLNFTAVFHQANANTLNPQHDVQRAESETFMVYFAMKLNGFFFSAMLFCYTAVLLIFVLYIMLFSFVFVYTSLSPPYALKIWKSLLKCC